MAHQENEKTGWEKTFAKGTNVEDHFPKYRKHS